MLLGCRVLDRLRIDDVVGAVPVHLFAGIWGTLAVTLTKESATLSAQVAGVAAVGAFVFILSLACWFVLRILAGLRLHPDHENSGGDLAEIGLRAYNFS
jgi:Amt family ammonium transporter